MARMLLAALGKAGFDVFLASREIAYSKRPGLEHLAMRKAAAMIEAGRLLSGFEANRNKPDLWFSYHPYDKSPDWLGEAVCLELGIPMVTAEPCKTAQGANGEWLAWREESKRIIAHAAMNLVMTHSDREFLATFVPDDRVTWFDPFVETTLLQGDPSTPDPWSAGPNGVRLLSVGMMRPGAKIESYTLLCESLMQLTDLDWSLVIAGGGPGEAEIQKQFAGLPMGRVQFLGTRSPGEILSLMAMAQVLAWPGCREAYGMVYLEAASVGLASVALNTMGVPRVVEHQRTGLLASPADADTYATMLRAIITDGELRARLGKGAAAFVAGERSGDAAAARLKLILENVLGHREP